jgi:hypothetical protein
MDVESAKGERGDGIDDRSEPSGFVWQVLMKGNATLKKHATVWPQYGPQTVTETRRHIND